MEESDILLEYNTKSKEDSMGFNPDDHFSVITIEDISSKLKKLEEMDFKKVSLRKELAELNYEITSPEYKDYIYSRLEEHYHFEVDTIV